MGEISSFDTSTIFARSDNHTTRHHARDLDESLFDVLCSFQREPFDALFATTDYDLFRGRSIRGNSDINGQSDVHLASSMQKGEVVVKRISRFLFKSSENESLPVRFVFRNFQRGERAPLGVMYK